MQYRLVLQQPKQGNPEYVMVSDEMAKKIREKLNADETTIQVEDTDGNLLRLEVSYFARISLEKVESQSLPSYTKPGHGPLDGMT